MPVNWSSAWAGALAAFAGIVVFGLIAGALGAGASSHGITSWHTLGFGTAVAAVLVSFFAFVVGGWVAGRVAGFPHAEPSILHAGMSWLLGLPMVMIALAFGAGGALGGWYGGLVTSPFVAASAPPSPETLRNTALGALTAVLLGLAGAVIGGWLASGEPMSFSHHRSRRALYERPQGGFRP